jgi:hypothetical protein
MFFDERMGQATHHRIRLEVRPDYVFDERRGQATHHHIQ